ncbi:hypothetical protein [Clostridium algidicarnis]|nr:hypothetical protein [Clostridium algidicarnis]
MAFELYGITEYLLQELSYRIKSLQSCMLKYDKYYPNIEVSKCYNDF